MPTKLGYKRVETDAEFKERILRGLGRNARYWTHDFSEAAGAFLDSLVWDIWKKQRRIVEVFP